MGINYSELIEKINQPFNVRDDLQHLDPSTIKENHQPKFPFAVCSINVDGSLNTGNIMRSAVLFGAEKFFVAGRRKFNRLSCVGAQNYVDIIRIDAMLNELDVDCDKVIETITSEGYTPVLCETGGTELTSYKFPKRPCFIFGNEGLGLPKSLIESISEIVSIWTPGVMRSLNVSNAASIVMHEFIRKEVM